jgi:preprotein translocase subunit SecD
VDGRRVIWEMSDAAKTILGTQAVEQAKQIIDTRINAVGVAEPILSDHGAQGSHQILLQMPGERDPERIKRTLTAESRLELVHVISPQGMLQKYPTKEAALQSIGGAETQTRKVYPYVERDAPAEGEPEPAQKPEPEWVVVESPNVIEGADLRDARASQGEAGGDAFQINFDLKPRGAEKFGRWTAANIGNYMGVVLDGQVKSIATIQSQINDSGRITGSFTKNQAEDLSLTLRSGALPARLVYLEERTVGASLGEDSIRAGVRASLAGLIFVILFMVIYYRGAGVNAVIALLLNMIITMAAMIWPLDAALTLPGIAGLILSVGMTVDTNVLIFERIREEMLTGKTIASAVDQGFSRAFVTIIDTHVTTIVSSLFLFIFGSGPIRGFAITLIIGLVANLFSAVYVSRTIFMWVLARKGKRAESLSI